MHPSPLRPTALSPQKQLPRWRPRDTPMPLGLATPAAHRTAKLNHVGPPSQGQEWPRGPTCTQTHAIQVGPKTQTPHCGFIFIPGEFRDPSISTAPEKKCCVRTLFCVGSSMPVSSRPRVSIIVSCSIGTVRLTSIACIISSGGPVRPLSSSP